MIADFFFNWPMQMQAALFYSLSYCTFWSPMGKTETSYISAEFLFDVTETVHGTT